MSESSVQRRLPRRSSTVAQDDQPVMSSPGHIDRAPDGCSMALLECGVRRGGLPSTFRAELPPERREDGCVALVRESNHQHFASPFHAPTTCILKRADRDETSDLHDECRKRLSTLCREGGEERTYEIGSR